MIAALALALGIVVSQAAPDDAARRAFEAANREFAEAKQPDDFLRVAARFEALRDEGYVGGAVLYDLGNAWFRAGEEGRAIAAWREAERYLPRDPRLAANLALARRETGQPAPPAALADRILFWQRWLSWPEKRDALLAAAALAFVLALLARRRGIALKLAAHTATAIAALLLASFALEWHRIERTSHGVVIAPEVVARKGDSESYAPAFTAPLREGQELRVAERRGEWLRVEVGDGLDGWVPDSALATW